MFKKTHDTLKPNASSSSKGFKTLFAQILTFIGGPVIVSYLVVGIILLSLVSSSVEQLAMNKLNANSLAASHEIDNYFEKHFQIVNTTAANSELEAFFTSLLPGAKIDESPGFVPIKNTLENVFRTNPDSILSVWIADVDSSQLAQSDGYVSDSSWNVQTRAWFQELSTAKTTILTEPYEDTVTKLQVTTIATPIFKAGTQDIIGAVGLDISLDTLVNTLRSYKLGDSGFYTLTTEAGLIISHPSDDYINRNITETTMSDSIQEAMISKTEGAVKYRSHGVDCHGYVSPVGDTGWMIATGLPNAEFYAEETAIRNVMLITFALSILVIFAIILVISKRIVTPIKALTETAHLIADGNLDVSAQEGSHDEVGQMASAINRTVLQLNQYIAYIREITHTLETMSQGDMRIHLEQDYVGEFASIKSAFTDLSISLNHTLRTIDSAAEQVSVGADQVSLGAQALAAGSVEQAASVEELSTSVEKIAEQAAENSSIVNTAVGYFEKVNLGFHTGIEQMGQLTEAMTEITSASEQIANITRAIEDIAFQTNILSLNAAIEAARAGDAGKGFAVVADEVRNLAAKSAEAAKQTSELIQISVSTVAKGTEMTAQTAQILQDVGETTVKVNDSFKQIEQSSLEQASAIDQIRDGLSQVSAVVQTNAATAEENSATSEEMSAQAATLREQVGNFKLKG